MTQESRNETVRLKIEFVDQEVNDLQIKYNNLVPYSVGEVFHVNEGSSKEYHRQSHPRKLRYEEPIIDVIDLDNNVEFWVTYGQLRCMVEEVA